MRFVRPIQLVSLFLLPIAGCSSSGWHFWKCKSQECEPCNACEGRLAPAETVTLGEPPVIVNPNIQYSDPNIYTSPGVYTDPSMLPDNFKAVEPVPSNSDRESVPTPAPDPAT